MNRANDNFKDVSNIDFIEIFVAIYDISFPKTNSRNNISLFYFEIQEYLLQHQ